MHRTSRTAVLAASALATAALAAACGGSGPSTPRSPSAADPSTSAPTTAMIDIDHVERGCHSWSLNGDPLGPTATVRMAAGGTLSVMDDDVMPHRLVQLSGPRATIGDAAMKRMGAMARVTFAIPGRYRFTTRAGEDYTAGITTIGPDHVLRLTVVVA